MTKEELEKEAEEYVKENTPLFNALGKEMTYTYKYMKQAYLAGAEPREKRIADLEVQIEKMKCCENCRWDTPSNFCDECTRFKGPIAPGAIDNWELRSGK